MRRSFLVLLLACAACAPRSGTAPQASTIPAEWAAQRELTADEQVAHALNRLAFGPRPGDLMRVRRMGVDAWIERQLHPASIPDGANEALVAAAFPSTATPVNDLVAANPPPNLLRMVARRDSGGLSADDSARLRQAARASQRLIADVQAARAARAVGSERQLEQVLLDFWTNHFNVFAGKNQPMRYLLASYEREAIRPHVLGNFRELLGAVAKSPAMLIYLDNWQSMADSTRPTLRPGRRARPDGPGARRARGLNENYGRELLELHTLGVDGGYTQRDVINVARALTGWSLRLPRMGGGFAFRPEMHDAGEKVVLGHTLHSGRGIEDGEEVLDILASHPATARFIATKLARRFVSDTPPPALVDRAADTFLRTHGDIRETVRVIVASPEFWSRAAYRAKVKSPFETVVSAARALGAAPDTTPVTARAIALLGQPTFGHQAPDGWPETGEPWMNTGAILNRINFGTAVAAGRLPGARVSALPGADTLRAAPRHQQVDAVIAILFAGAASTDTRAILMKGENPLARDGGSMAVSPAMPLRRAPTLQGLEQVVGLALGAPEFQRR